MATLDLTPKNKPSRGALRRAAAKKAQEQQPLARETSNPAINAVEKLSFEIKSPETIEALKAAAEAKRVDRAIRRTGQKSPRQIEAEKARILRKREDRGAPSAFDILSRRQKRLRAKGTTA